MDSWGWLYQFVGLAFVALALAHPWLVVHLARPRSEGVPHKVQYLGEPRSEPVKESLPGELLVGPVMGWKRTQVIVAQDLSGVTLKGLAFSPHFGLEADAVCALGCNEVLSDACTCGFYAYGSMGAALAHVQGQDRDPLVRVAISGRFVEYEHGWRFSHQRVEKVEFSTPCFSCSRPAAALVAVPEMSPLGLCRRHTLKYVKNKKVEYTLVSFAELRGIILAQAPAGRPFECVYWEEGTLSPRDIDELTQAERPPGAPPIRPVRAL